MVNEFYFDKKNTLKITRPSPSIGTVADAHKERAIGTIMTAFTADPARGDTELRGFEDPVRVYEVRWREEA